jgi:hypothetical protein
MALALQPDQPLPDRQIEIRKSSLGNCLQDTPWPLCFRGNILGVK